MKYLYVILASLILGCSTKPDIHVPAVTVTRTPFFRNQKELSDNDPFQPIPAFAKLFLEGDSLIVRGKTFVRITWENESGYTLASNVLAAGRRGVLFGSPAMVFRDKQMTVVRAKSDIRLAAIGREIPGGSEVAVAFRDSVIRGYAIIANCFTDSLDLAFARKIIAVKYSWDADPQRVGLNLVFDDPAFAHSVLRKSYVDDYHARQTADTTTHAFARWVDGNGKLLTQGESPGIFGVGFIFEDGTESTRNHLGDVLGNDYSSCSNKRITGLKMYFVPTSPIDYFVFSANSSDQEGHAMTAQDSVTKPEIGKRYSFSSFRGDCNDVVLELITSHGHRGTGTIAESCGD